MRSMDFNQFLVNLTDAIQCKCEHVIKQCIPTYLIPVFVIFFPKLFCFEIKYIQ